MTSNDLRLTIQLWGLKMERRALHLRLGFATFRIKYDYGGLSECVKWTFGWGRQKARYTGRT